MNQEGEFDITKLHIHQERRNLEKTKLYNIILKRAYHRIETVAIHNHHCLFTIPEFLLGMPLYDAYQCSGYILQKLKKNGFKVCYYHPNIIHINWLKDNDQQNNNDQRNNDLNSVLTAGSSNNISSTPPLKYVPTGKLFQTD